MKDFRYEKCKIGDILCLTTLNKADSMFVEFEKGMNLFAKIIEYSSYMMTIKDSKGNKHSFISDWFKDTLDEFHGKPSLYNPDGISIKFRLANENDLPFWLRLKNKINMF